MDRDEKLNARLTEIALSLPWFSGQGRQILAGEPGPELMVLGAMNTPELAAEACAGHNALLEGRTV